MFVRAPHRRPARALQRRGGGASAARRGPLSPRRASRGFTLIEMLVVLALAVLVIGLGLSSLGDLKGTQLRTQTNRLAAAIRHTYSRAVAHGLHMRMVFDLDAETYYVEASDQPIFLPSTKRAEGADPNAPTEEELEQAKEDAERDEDETPKFRLKRAQYQDDGVIPKVTMEKGIGIAGVLTSGQTEEFVTGKAYVHFFPNGFVEPAIIHITDGDTEDGEGFLTLVVDPLTGKVTRLPGRAEANRLFGVPDDVQDER